MRFRAHFYLLNDDFSQEFADKYHKGEPTENNRLYDWQDELVLKNEVTSVQVERHATYTLKGQDQEGNLFEETIKDMVVFFIKGEDGSTTEMACSERLLFMYEIDRGLEEIKLSVVMNEKEPLTNPIPGVYIAVVDFPTHLM